MDNASLIKFDIALGAVVGALSGASAVANDYQRVFHQHSLAAYSSALDAENEWELAEMSHRYGLDTERVVEYYRGLRDSGADQERAMRGTEHQIEEALAG